ncbi:SpoIIE family protein phosphatase [bacterium]|nr:SpoIIE family protein phosphatase [bacterium]
MFKTVIKILLYSIGIIAMIIVLSTAGIKLFNYYVSKDIGFDTEWENEKLIITGIRGWSFLGFKPYEEIDTISDSTTSEDLPPDDTTGDSTLIAPDDNSLTSPHEDSVLSKKPKVPPKIHISFGDPQAVSDTVLEHQSLKIGDVITSVNDTSITSDSMWQAVKSRFFETGKLKFTITREGESIRYKSSTILNFKGINFEVILLILALLVGILFWLVGFVVYMKKPFGAPNILYYLWSLTVFLFLSSAFLGGFDCKSFTIIRYVTSRLLILNSAFFLHLFLIFPHKKHILQRKSKWVIYALIYLIPIIATPEAYLSRGQGSIIPPLQIALLGFIVVFGEYAIGIIALLRSYKRAKSEYEKKQVKIITRGILITGIPLMTFLASVMMILMVIFSLIGFSPVSVVNFDLASLPKIATLAFGVFGILSGLSLIATIVSLPVVPLSFAYSILKYRILDVKLIVRRSLIYTLVTVFVVLTYIIIVVGLSSLTIGVTGRESQISAILAAVVVAVLFNPVRLRIQNWVDKKFFRESYDFRRALENLSEEIARITDIDELISKTSKQVYSLLHILHIVTFTKRGSPFKVRACLGLDYEELTDVVFYPDPGGLIDFLKTRKSPLLIPYAESRGDLKGIDSTDLHKLSKLRAKLVMPIFIGDTLIGLQSFGEKLSEQYYSDSDIRLLKNLANQLGVALENARLYEEELEKKRLENEIHLAREIQQNFLPKSIPVIEGFDFYGTNIPANTVGGDYYDFIRISNRKVAVAIGDVAGKGYPGALLMSNLQAMLRMSVEQELAPVQIDTKLNKLIFENSPPDKFITFFYGQLDADKSELNYVNAGHNPPLLFSGENEIKTLTEGGIVLGAFPDFAYIEGNVKIEPGDVVLLYTDGVTETMDQNEEEFGEERLINVVRKCLGLSPSEISETVMDELQEFSEGGIQEDDITIVILKKNR